MREVNIPTLLLLQQLSDWVIKQNEKRLPKWKFRFAPDFVMQIHPRITRAYDALFECLALQTEGATAVLFTDPSKLRGRQHYRARFDLRVRSGVWTFHARGGQWSLGGTREEYFNVQQRAIDALKPEHFADLNPAMMLAPNCLCCGKGLTDPVSMARWVGPECWGSASTNLPNIFKAKAGESSLEPGVAPLRGRRSAAAAVPRAASENNTAPSKERIADDADDRT